MKALTKQEKSKASARICSRLVEVPRFFEAETVFAYLPLASEPDLTALFGPEKSWGFARVMTDDEMEFRQVTDLSHTIEGDFKIREPDPELCPVLHPDSVDVVIIPGVGFCEKTGNRLGRGKGHYDRYLGKLLERPEPPLLVGVCFSVQLCEVSAESHDVAMDMVIHG